MYDVNVTQDIVVKQHTAPRNDVVYTEVEVYCPMCEIAHWNNTNCQRVD